jgi:Zn-dependent peptidase ImmA (M78 family)
METADKKAIVEEFHKQNRPPYSMDELAEKLGVETFKAGFEDNRVSGWIERRPDNSFQIVVNKNHPLKRRRFTLAHELAHFILHEHKIGKDVVDTILYRSDLSDYLEHEANRTAADLLMPANLLEQDILDEWQQKGGYDKTITKEGPDTKSLNTLIAKLAKKYNVSKAAMQIRIGTKFGLWPND